MPKPRRKYGWMHDLTYQAELNWENATVQFTGEGWLRAIEASRKADALVQDAIERALRCARRNRRDGEVR